MEKTHGHTIHRPLRRTKSQVFKRLLVEISGDKFEISAFWSLSSVPVNDFYIGFCKLVWQ